MRRVLATIAIDDFGVGPLGVKEALVMAVEHLGGVQVLSVEVQEPEQMRMAGGAFAPPRRAPKPESIAPVPPRTGQAPARSSPRPQTTMQCCFNCASYQSDPIWDADGNLYWGVCRLTREPVREIWKGCPAWTRLGG